MKRIAATVVGVSVFGLTVVSLSLLGGLVSPIHASQGPSDASPADGNAAVDYFHALLAARDFVKVNDSVLEDFSFAPGPSPWLLGEFAEPPAERLAEFLRRGAQRGHCDFQFRFNEGDLHTESVELVGELRQAVEVHLSWLLQAGRIEEASRFFDDVVVFVTRWTDRAPLLTSLVGLNVIEKALGVFEAWVLSGNLARGRVPDLRPSLERARRVLRTGESIRADLEWFQATVKKLQQDWTKWSDEERQEWWSNEGMFTLVGTELPPESWPAYRSLYTAAESQDESSTLSPRGLSELPTIYAGSAAALLEVFDPELARGLTGDRAAIESALPMLRTRLRATATAFANENKPLLTTGWWSVVLGRELRFRARLACFEELCRWSASDETSTVDPLTGRPLKLEESEAGLVIATSEVTADLSLGFINEDGDSPWVEPQAEALDLRGRLFLDRRSRGWLLPASAAQRAGLSDEGFAPDREDCHRIEAGLRTFLGEQEEYDLDPDDLDYHERQFVGYVVNGRRMIAVNLVIDAPESESGDNPIRSRFLSLDAEAEDLFASIRVTYDLDAGAFIRFED